MMVTTLNRLKQQVAWPYPRLCASLGLPYASFRRWKHRLEQGQPALFKPGPHKVGPLRLEELHADLCCLKHGRQRSRGVGRLYRYYQDQISRRDLQALTRAVRRELAQQRQAELRHITWQVPGLVWSLDDAELAGFAHHRLYLHQVQDLASRYKFTPRVGEQVLGETVAVHLEQLFLRSALQRRDGMCGAGTENSAGGKDPRQRPDHEASGASLGGSAGARTEPSLPRLSPGACCL